MVVVVALGPPGLHELDEVSPIRLSADDAKGLAHGGFEANYLQTTAEYPTGYM